MKRTLVEVSDAKGISGEASQVGEFRENCCPGKRVSQGSGNNAAEIRMFKYICRGPGRDEERIPGDQRKLILIIKCRHAAELNPVGWKEKLNKLGYVTEEFPQPCTEGKAGFFFAADRKMGEDGEKLRKKLLRTKEVISLSLQCALETGCQPSLAKEKEIRHVIHECSNHISESRERPKGDQESWVEDLCVLEEQRECSNSSNITSLN